MKKIDWIICLGILFIIIAFGITINSQREEIEILKNRMIILESMKQTFRIEQENWGMLQRRMDRIEEDVAKITPITPAPTYYNYDAGP